MFLYFIDIELGKADKKQGLIEFVDDPDKSYDGDINSIYLCREVASLQSHWVKSNLVEHFGEEYLKSGPERFTFKLGIKKNSDRVEFSQRVFNMLGYDVQFSSENRLQLHYINVPIENISPQFVSFCLFLFKIQLCIKKEHNNYEKIIEECLFDRAYDLVDVFDYLPYTIFPLWYIDRYSTQFPWDINVPVCSGVSSYVTRIMYQNNILVEEFMSFLDSYYINPSVLGFEIDGYKSFRHFYEERIE